MSLEVHDSGRNPVENVPVQPDGSFELRSVRRGTYYLTVRNGAGETVHSDVLSVTPMMQRTTIRIAGNNKAERPVSGTISASRLAHKVPKAARKEFERAAKATAAHKPAEAVARLQKAIEIDPEYMEAYNNLGTAYIQTDQPEKALESFQKAAELDASVARVQGNMALAYMTLRRLPEAEAAARRAVELDASDMKARFILGLTLYTQRQFTPEAVDQLRRAQDDFPQARVALAIMQANAGDRDAARRELEGYLETGHQDKREQAQAMLAALEQTN